MKKERLNPLNDFAFQKAMGEKGDEVQLTAFLNAVLKRTGKNHIESVEILEDKDMPASVVGGKAGKLDVLAKLADRTKVDIEVQLANQYNMERRSLAACCTCGFFALDAAKNPDYPACFTEFVG